MPKLYPEGKLHGPFDVEGTTLKRADGAIREWHGRQVLVRPGEEAEFERVQKAVSKVYDGLIADIRARAENLLNTAARWL